MARLLRSSIYCLVGLLLIPLGSQAVEWKAEQIVDLTHPYDERTIYWPTEEGFVLQKEFEGMTEKGYFYAANRFCSPEHGGTHLDAPLHFAEGKESVDQIPLERLVGGAVLVDVSEAAAKDRDYQVTARDFENWEKDNGRIPDGAIVILRTGFSRFWPDRKKYLGTEGRGPEAVKQLRFPGLHPKAALWLAGQRKIKSVGIDTASIDHGPSTHFETHRALFAESIPAFENLANLERLPNRGFTILALPMKIQGGSGAPLRIIAILESKE